MPPRARSSADRPAPRRPSRDWTRDLPFETIVLHRTVGLYRNLADAVFPPRATTEMRVAVREKLRGAMERAFGRRSVEFSDDLAPEPEDRGPLAFLENPLAALPLSPPPPPDSSEETPAIVFLKGGAITALVGGQDHLSLFCRSEGMFSAQHRAVTAAAEAIAKYAPFAQSPEYGYLAADPDHVGSGLVLSCDMCLFGLYISRTVEKALHALDRLGFATVAAYGPFLGEENPIDVPGCIYRVVSDKNDGSERDIIGRMDAVCRELARQEQNARLTLVRNSSPDLSDFIGRSLANGANAFSMQQSEAIDIAQASFFAADCGLFSADHPDLAALRAVPLELGESRMSAALGGPREPRFRRAALLAPYFERLLRAFRRG